MESYEIRLTDWARIFAGQAPPLFYLELVIRAIIIYALLMASMRFLGKRVTTNASRLELAATVSLASAIGVPMLAPDRGLLPALIIAVIVVGITWLIGMISVHNQRFERITQGSITTLIEDGVLQVDQIKKTRLTKNRVLAYLRSLGLSHLGLVKRLYIEPNGSFAMIDNDNPKPGLAIIPDWDKEFMDRRLKQAELNVCKNCGTSKPGEEPICPKCHATEWVRGVMERENEQHS